MPPWARPTQAWRSPSEPPYACSAWIRPGHTSLDRAGAGHGGGCRRSSGRSERSRQPAARPDRARPCSTAAPKPMQGERGLSLHRDGEVGTGRRAIRPEAAQLDTASAPPAAPLRIGIGGPVGSGKTALVAALCKQMSGFLNIAVVTNDIYTTEDADFLRRSRRPR